MTSKKHLTNISNVTLLDFKIYIRICTLAANKCLFVDILSNVSFLLLSLQLFALVAVDVELA